MDWAEEWIASIKLTSRDRLNSGAFWDDRASNMKHRLPDKMTDDQLAIIKPEADQRIIEIGPGNGRLTIPLARSSSEVTVVDPSPLMLRSLMDRSREEGLNNLRCVNDHWEHVDVATFGRCHKLVSSYSLFMYDVGEQMRRMGSVSDAVYLFVPADIRIPFAVQEIMFGRVMVERTDFEILSGIARELGFKPRAYTEEYQEGDGFDSLETAIEYYLEFYNVPESKEEQVAEHLSSAIRTEGEKFVLSGTRNVGVIWWQKG